MRVGGAGVGGAGATVIVGGISVENLLGLLRPLFLLGLLMLTFPVTGIVVLSSLLHLLICVRLLLECRDGVLDVSRETLVVVMFENGIGIMELGSMLVELHAVTDNLPIILHLDILNGFFCISHWVDVSIVFSENSEKLGVVVGPLGILVELVRIYKPGLEPFDGWPLEVAESKVNFLIILLVLIQEILEVQFALEDKSCKFLRV